MLLEFDVLQVSGGEVLAVLGSTNLQPSTVPSVTVSVDALKEISTWSEVASSVNGSVLVVIWSTLAVSGGAWTGVSDDFPLNFFWVVFKVHGHVMTIVIFAWVSNHDLLEFSVGDGKESHDSRSNSHFYMYLLNVIFMCCCYKVQLSNYIIKKYL